MVCIILEYLCGLVPPAAVYLARLVGLSYYLVGSPPNLDGLALQRAGPPYS